jgi:hypothetical protein
MYTYSSASHTRAAGTYAANTAINHMDTIARYGADLDNTDVRIVNAAKQAISAALGGNAPTSFDALRKTSVEDAVNLNEKDRLIRQFLRGDAQGPLTERKAATNYSEELLQLGQNDLKMS